MKKMFVLLVVLLMAASAQAVSPLPVSYWEFEGSAGTIEWTDYDSVAELAADTMGNNVGILSNLDFATCSVAGREIGNNALRFYGEGVYLNGNESGIAVPASTSLNSYTAMSAMCWVKVDDYAGDNPHISAFMGNEDSAQNGFGMVEYPDAKLDVYAGAGAYAPVGQAAMPGVGEWMMLTYTWDGASGRTYINGAPAGGPTAQANQSSPTALLVLGNCVPYGPRQLFGAMDEAAFWNVALSDADVADVYANGVTIPEPATMALLGLGALGLFRKRR